MKNNLLLFILLALLLPATTSAYEFEVDGIFYTRLFGEIYSDTEVKVTYDSSSYGPSYSGDITIPANVTYDGTTYSVTAIDERAFSWCPGLTSIDIPSSVRYIGDYAFSWCTALTGIVIPSSVKYIGEGVFYECTRLTNITIPNSVEYIGKQSFDNTKWYNNQPDGIVYAGLIAYKYKGNMPTGTSLTLVVGTIGVVEYAFYGCEGLVSIVIPGSVTTIGNFAFYECVELETVKCLGTVPPRMAGYDCFSEQTYSNATLLVPRNCEETYAATDNWWLFNNIEGWDVTSPGDVNADGQVNITDVTVLIDYLLSGNSSGVSMLGADVDGDGNIIIADVTFLIDMLLSGN